MSEKVTVIMQPTYMSWLGYFDLINKSDVFIFLDNVQFSKQSWQCKNKINTNNDVIMLNVPIVKAPLNTKIIDIKIKDPKFYIKHLQLIKCYYQKCIFFQEIYQFLVDFFYSTENFSLSQLNIELIKRICNLLNINKQFYLSSELNLPGNRTELLYNMCNYFQTTIYLSPIGSAVYLENEKEIFNKNNIKIKYQNFICHQYKQQFENFTPYLSIIDVLMNVEKQEIKERLLLQNY